MKCPKCGTENHGSAWSCEKCGTRLSFLASQQDTTSAPPVKQAAPVVTAQRKTCPRCGSWNSTFANRCNQCGAALAANEPPSIPQPVQRVALHIGLWVVPLFVCAILLVGIPFGLKQTGILDQLMASNTTDTSSPPTPRAAPTLVAINPLPLGDQTAAPTAPPTLSFAAKSTATVPPQICQNLAATVSLIVSVDGKPGVAVSGSGSILTPKGYILTNYHVMVDTQTGKPWNKNGQAKVYITVQSNRPPQFMYLALVDRLDAKNDLALLHIAGRADGSALPASLNLPAFPIGDSDTVNIGDELSIIGYPSLGGDSITCSKGIISGFTQGYMKTDAELNPGNSGGAAVNLRGELVGVPSAANISLQTAGKVGLIRPINAARAMIDYAMQGMGK